MQFIKASKFFKNTQILLVFSTVMFAFVKNEPGHSAGSPTTARAFASDDANPILVLSTVIRNKFEYCK